MKRSWNWIVPVVALAVLASPVLAGGADCQKSAAAAKTASHKGCTASGEECMKAMAEFKKDRGWLGVELEPAEDGGYVITSVVPSSPAEKAGFRMGDVLVAVNGITFSEENHEKLAAAKKELRPGVKASYVVRRDGEQQILTAKLSRMPDEVYTAWVAKHMKEDHPEYAANR